METLLFIAGACLKFAVIIGSDEIDMLLFILGACILAQVVFLIRLGRLPRCWRWVIYGVFCAVNIFLGFLDRLFDYFQYNVDYGQKTQTFFETLQHQLEHGTYAVEYLEPPSFVGYMCLSALALLAIIGGAAILGLKVRWYSYLVTLAALALSPSLTALSTPFDRREYINDSNALRYRCYLLVGQKLGQDVTPRQIAGAIESGLKDFLYSYENRRVERESTEKILNAIRELQPPKDGGK